MRVIVDSREQIPWTFPDDGFTLIRKHLDAGDYSVEGLENRVSIERKSLDDWTGTVLRDRSRFYRELELLRAYEFRCVIIEAGIREIMARQYRSQAHPNSIIGFVAEVTVSQSVPVYLAGSRPEAQLLAGAFLRMAAKKISPHPTSVLE